MTKEIPKYIVQKDETTGEEYAIKNPVYQKYVQNEKYDLYLKDSFIPSFYHNVKFSDYKGKETEEFKKIKYYAEHCTEEKFNNISLYLYGLNGCQKTALACNIGKEAIKSGLRVKFILAGDLIDMMIKVNGFNYDQDMYNKMEDLKSYDLLIIDDCWDNEKSLYFRNNPEMIVAEWDRFLRDRLSNGVKIIMTSNFSLDIIAEKYGRSLFELLDRNFMSLQLTESVKEIRKLSVKNVFDDMEE